MSASTLTWGHIRDLHMDEANGWQSRDRLAVIVDEINTHVGRAAEFVHLPGDNANHLTVEQYRVITDALAPLSLPYRVIPGDHDFELGDLANYDAAFPEGNRPEEDAIAGHRCIFLDVIHVLVRGEKDIPRRGMPIAPGRDIHSIGPWPEYGIEGTRLGPNKNGKHW